MKNIKHLKLLAWDWMLKFYCLTEITYSEELNLTLQGQGNTILTLEEAVFKFDLKFTIFTEYTETCRSACFQGLWMFHDSCGEWTDCFKKTFQWLVKFHHHRHCKGHTTSLMSRYWDSSMICPWETLTVQDSLSVTFFSILNLCVAPTLHSRFRCTFLWNTFDHSFPLCMTLTSSDIGILYGIYKMMFHFTFQIYLLYSKLTWAKDRILYSLCQVHGYLNKCLLQ